MGCMEHKGGHFDGLCQRLIWHIIEICNATMLYECIEDGEQYPKINRWDQ